MQCDDTHTSSSDPAAAAVPEGGPQEGHQETLHSGPQADRKESTTSVDQGQHTGMQKRQTPTNTYIPLCSFLFTS